MTDIAKLMIDEQPVSRGLTAKVKISKPNVAVVYSDAFGRIAYLGGRPLSWSEQVASKYRTRYEVNLSDFRRQASLQSSPLPSRGDAYFFRCIVDVGFRVTDPAEVVRRHVTDGAMVVYNYLMDTFRPVTRRYDITDAEGAEEELNRVFQRPWELPEGITIYFCSTRLTPDSTAQVYLRELETAQRDVTLGSARHGVDVAALRHDQELAGIDQHGRFDSDDRELAVRHRRAMEAAERTLARDAAEHEAIVAATRQAQVVNNMDQQARLQSEARELAALAGRPIDLPGLLQLHLARHPDETQYAIELLGRHQQAAYEQAGVYDDRRQDLVRYMADRGLIQSADVEKLRTRAIDQLAEATGAGRPEFQAAQAASSWDEPLRSGPQSGPPARVIPVYVVIDVSVSDSGYFQVLNSSFQALPSELASHENILGAIRLALIGYGGGVDVRMPLNPIAAGSHVPEFAYHEGSDLGVLFDDLYTRIPQDIDRLKAQGLTSGRPVVHLLCAAPADQDPRVAQAYQRITDPAAFRYHPIVIACGIGRTQPESIGRLASHAQLAWVAGPDTPVSEATTRYLAFVRTSIIGLSQAHLQGSSDIPILAGPNGFISAARTPS
ncbi:MAG TPA: hypothetical protein VGM14_10960 [Streptosporangiaceae bacterium]|jgi:uncharacterized protein YegL